MAQLMDDADQQAREIGRLQSLFREVNERIDELAEVVDIQGLIILCECGLPDCAERVTVSRDEYERIRRIPTHFAVLDGHQLPAVERVVERRDGFIVVEKFGESAKAAICSSPKPVVFHLRQVAASIMPNTCCM